MATAGRGIAFIADSNLPARCRRTHNDFLKAVKNGSNALMMFAQRGVMFAQRREPSGQTKKRNRRFMLSRPAFRLRPLAS